MGCEPRPFVLVLTMSPAPEPTPTQPVQRSRASSPNPKKDVIDVGSTKDKENKSVTKECAPKPSFAKRFLPATRASGLRLVALMVAIVVACVGAYFGWTSVILWATSSLNQF